MFVEWKSVTWLETVSLSIAAFLTFQHKTGNPGAEKEVNDVPGGSTGERRRNRREEECPHCFIEGNCGANPRRRIREEDGTKKRECDGRSPQKMAGRGQEATEVSGRSKWKSKLNSNKTLFDSESFNFFQPLSWICGVISEKWVSEP